MLVGMIWLYRGLRGSIPRALSLEPHVHWFSLLRLAPTLPGTNVLAVSRPFGPIFARTSWYGGLSPLVWCPLRLPFVVWHLPFGVSFISLFCLCVHHFSLHTFFLCSRKGIPLPLHWLKGLLAIDPGSLGAPGVCSHPQVGFLTFDLAVL